MKLFYAFLVFAIIAVLVFLSRAFLKFADTGRPVLALAGVAASFIASVFVLIGVVLKYLELPHVKSIN